MGDPLCSLIRLCSSHDSICRYSSPVRLRQGTRLYFLPHLPPALEVLEYARLMGQGGRRDNGIHTHKGS